MYKLLISHNSKLNIFFVLKQNTIYSNIKETKLNKTKTNLFKTQKLKNILLNSLKLLRISR